MEGYHQYSGGLSLVAWRDTILKVRYGKHDRTNRDFKMKVMGYGIHFFNKATCG